MHEPRALLERGLATLAVPMPPDAVEQLLAYLALMQKWNRTYNLTAIRDPRRMVTHHLLDSLAVVPHLPAGSLADVGAGAGLPGIPLAVVQPARRVTLNEASEKKAAFLRQAAIELKLAALKSEHRDLDDVIARVQESQPFDQLQLQRLKKRKLMLKDQIAQLESRLLPDIIA